MSEPRDTWSILNTDKYRPHLELLYRSQSDGFPLELRKLLHSKLQLALEIEDTDSTKIRSFVTTVQRLLNGNKELKTHWQTSRKLTAASLFSLLKEMARKEEQLVVERLDTEEAEEEEVDEGDEEEEEMEEENGEAAEVDDEKVSEGENEPPNHELSPLRKSGLQEVPHEEAEDEEKMMEEELITHPESKNDMVLKEVRPQSPKTPDQPAPVQAHTSTESSSEHREVHLEIASAPKQTPPPPTSSHNLPLDVLLQRATSVLPRNESVQTTSVTSSSLLSAKILTPPPIVKQVPVNVAATKPSILKSTPLPNAKRDSTNTPIHRPRPTSNYIELSEIEIKAAEQKVLNLIRRIEEERKAKQ